MSKLKKKDFPSIKILYIDIETLLALYGCWGDGKFYVSWETMFKEWRIASISWCWGGSTKVRNVKIDRSKMSFDIREMDDESDKELLLKFYKVALKADVIVAHNGKNFDVRRINGRLFRYGLDPLPIIPLIDTCQDLKKQVHLVSYSLNYISRLLGLGSKIKTSIDLWMRVTKGEKAALDEMVRYNNHDVFPLLVKLHPMIEKYLSHSVNSNKFAKKGDDLRKCPNPLCGSSNIEYRGWAASNSSGTRHRKVKCNDCGKWGQVGRVMHLPGR